METVRARECVQSGEEGRTLVRDNGVEGPPVERGELHDQEACVRIGAREGVEGGQLSGAGASGGWV